MQAPRFHINVGSIAAAIVKWCVVVVAACAMVVAAFNFIQLTGLALYDSWIAGTDSSILAELIVATYLPCMAFVVIMVSVLSCMFMRAVWRASEGIAGKIRARFARGNDSEDSDKDKECDQ